MKLFPIAALGAVFLATLPAQGASQDLDFPTAPKPPAGDAFPERSVQFPGGVVALADVTYDTQVGYRPLTLDLYRDPNAAEPRPAILYIHGGGWERSHKRTAGVFTDFPGVLANLAARGFVVASAEYRLSGEAPFPAGINDVRAAIRFLRDNADEYGIDPERIGIWGSSAGGQLAALAAVSCDESDLELFAKGTSETSTCVSAAAIWYGIFDFGSGEAPEPSLSANVPTRFLGCTPGYCANYLVKAASPISHVDEKDPPFLLAHGTDDQIVPISQSQFEARLKDAGVAVQTHYVDGVDHSFVAPEEALTRRSALEAMGRTFDFFTEQLKPATSQ
ncbi:alpha/beta hydrolase [Chelativorans xinjiangense]|uniref:alpha/beta hydrolase n=1 Tax=Chelativorans xinjiangense TaxID=2681485 RepID=UPI0013587B0B|nr:alpha/beta hydrolase [Chelativorans xinjiangense]